MYDVNGSTNYPQPHPVDSTTEVIIHPIDFERYKTAFEKVQQHLNKGDSYLLNLTFPSKIILDTSLENIFHRAKAPYRLWVKDQLLSYSPECFIKIKKGQLFSYPMKGTIDARHPNARNPLGKP